MSRRWIGLDPALSAFGWAVMNHERGGQPTMVAMGTIRTHVDKRAGKLEDRARRFNEVMQALRKVFVEHEVAEAYVESPAMVPGATSYLAIAAAGRARGIVECMCFMLGVPLAEVDSKVVKHAVTGRLGSSKEDVAKVLQRAYLLTKDELGDLNASDALGVAHVGAARYGQSVSVSSGVVKYSPQLEEALASWDDDVL